MVVCQVTRHHFNTWGHHMTRSTKQKNTKNYRPSSITERSYSSNSCPTTWVDKGERSLTFSGYNRDPISMASLRLTDKVFSSFHLYKVKRWVVSSIWQESPKGKHTNHPDKFLLTKPQVSTWQTRQSYCQITFVSVNFHTTLSWLSDEDIP